MYESFHCILPSETHFNLVLNHDLYKMRWYTHIYSFWGNIFVIFFSDSPPSCNLVPFQHYFSLIFNHSVIIDNHEQKKISEYNPITTR